MVQCLIFTDTTDTFFSRSAGAYRIATQLRDEGYTVRVIDFFTKWPLDKLEKAIEKFVGADTLMVGFSSTFFRTKIEGPRSKSVGRISSGAQFVGVNKESFPYPDEMMEPIFTWIKRENPKAKIVLGGTKADNRDSKFVDYFVSGFADLTVVDLMQHIEGKCWLNASLLPNGSQWINATATRPVHQFNHDIRYAPEDFIYPTEQLPLEVARGCIFKCAFCAYPLNGKKRNEYMKDYGLIREEFIRNYEMFGTTNYVMVDDTYNDAMDKVEGMAKVIQSLPFKIQFCCYARLDILYHHKEMADILSESGMKSVVFGIETLNHETGRLIGKGMHPGKTKEALQWCRSKWGDKVLMKSGFIVGLPKEPIESVVETFGWTLSADCPLDTVSFYALSIVGSEQRVYTSELAKGAGAAYNYRFPKPEDPLYWVNDHMNYYQAKALVAQFEIELNRKSKIGGLQYLSFKDVLNVSDDEDWRVTKREFDGPLYWKNGTERVDEYISKVLSC